MKKRRYDDSPRAFTMRLYLFPVILLLIAGLFFWRLISLQIINGAGYRMKSDLNRLRTLVIHAPRGVVFDRNGKPLIQNIPGFHQLTKNPDGTIKSEVITKEQALSLIAKGATNIEIDSLREYPDKDAASHILGYMGQISKEEYDQNKDEGYQMTDWIGKSGIERTYEAQLRGQDGRQLYEVDAFGKITRLLGQTDPVPGKDITLTIDSDLQDKTYSAAKDIQKGAVIVSKPDGEILSMVSKPSYDPNLFTLDKTYKAASTSSYATVQDIVNDTKQQPLLNRAIAGLYPPGSTFKIIVASAGLEDNIIDADYTVVDIGILKVGDFSFANWYYTQYGKKEQEPLNVIRALTRSNDIFFYKLAEKVGIDKISDMAKKFGLGEKLGIDLNGEESGLVPTKEWKKEYVKEPWYLGDTYHYGIGQGYLLTTPLQVNMWTTVIANGGILYQPHLIKNQKSKIKDQNILSEKNLDLIRQGMIGACSTGGVAYPLFNFKVKNAKLKIDGKNFLKVASASADMRQVSLACKTGTAEHGDSNTNPHAWITLFAPAYDPQIVITVLIESGGEGSDVAAPVAKKILEAYFSK